MQWLLNEGEKPTKICQLTAFYFEQLALAGREGIGILLQFHCQIVGTMAVPDKMQDDGRVCCLVLIFRARSRGNYLASFAAAGGLADAKRLRDLLGLHGCYRLTFNEAGVLIKVTHITGIEGAIPAHLSTCITRAFQLLDNHLDHEARLLLLPSIYYLRDFFPEECGFKKDMLVKGKKALFMPSLVVKAEKELAAKDHAASREVVKGCTSALKAADKRQKDSAIDKARKALAATRAERVAKRSFVLAAPAEAS